MAANLISNRIEQFESMRHESTVDNKWQQLLNKSKSFANDHLILVQIDERRKQKRMMDGEVSRDEARTGEERMRVDMFLPVLDQICMQLRDRFDDGATNILTEMALFTSSQLKGRITITSEDITQLTATYNLNPDAVVSEYADFCGAFSLLDAPGH